MTFADFLSAHMGYTWTATVLLFAAFVNWVGYRRARQSTPLYPREAKRP